MGIFSKIKDAIFGHPKAKAAPPTQTVQKPAMPQMQPKAAPQAQAQTAPQQPVDVEAVLSDIAESKGQQLNWRSSIVDLMKLLDLDPSLDNRRELAAELGYTGDRDGSAEMNIWLHKQVMAQLEKNGGKVPASMKD
jgi:hypothetical protein